MEIKVGDKVRVREDAPEIYFFGCNHDDSVCKVIFIDRDEAVIIQPKKRLVPHPYQVPRQGRCGGERGEV